MAKKMKKYLVVAELWYDYDDDMIDEWDDNGDKELTYLSADGVRWELTSWLEDLGFNVDIRVVENKE